MTLDPEEKEALAFLDFLPHEPSPAPRIGEEVQGYRLIREIGCGGGGVVYEAMHLDLQRPVALKITPLVAADLQGSGAERIRREARMLAKLRHPHIVEIHDSGLLPGYRWVAMRLVEGPTLAGLMTHPVDGFPRPGTEAWIPFVARLFRQISAALGHAHGAGILHRDVKPSNILLDGPEHAFLADFGLARPRTEKTDELTQGFLGSPNYAAPEQFRDVPHTAATDVYGLGATAFESLSGQVPFPAAATLAGQRDIMVKLPKGLTGQEAPPDLAAIVLRCLEKRPLDRYEDGNALAEEFERFLQGLPVMARHRPWWSRQWLRMRLQPVRSLALGSLLVLLGATGYLGNRLAVQEDVVADMRVEDILQDAEELFHGIDYDGFDAFLAELDLGSREFLPLLEYQADRFLNERRYEDAEASYRRAVLLNPSEENELGLAYCLWRLELGPEPPRILSDTSSLRSLYLLMLLAEHDGAMERALELASTALPLHDTSVLLLCSKGHYLQRIGRTTEAVESFQRCVALAPRHGGLHEMLIRILASQQKSHQAAEAGLRALDQEVETIGILTATGSALQLLGRLEEAWDLFLRASAIDPEGEDVRVARMEVLLLRSSGDADGAIAAGQEHLRTWTDDPHLLQVLVGILLEQERIEEARQSIAILAGSTRKGWRKSAQQLEARVLLLEGKVPEALALLRDPQLGRSGKRLLIKTLLENDAQDEAESLCRTYLDLNASDIGIRHSYVLLLSDQGRFEEALDQAIEAYGHGPAKPECHFWLGRTYLNLDQPEKALRHVQKANDTRRHWADALALEAACLEALGKAAEARRIRDSVRLLEEDPQAVLPQRPPEHR